MMPNQKFGTLWPSRAMTMAIWSKTPPYRAAEMIPGEIEHYQILSNYINDRGSVATVPTIEAPDERLLHEIFEAFGVPYSQVHEVRLFDPAAQLTRIA